jgi:hypothetical protein
MFSTSTTLRALALAALVGATLPALGQPAAAPVAAAAPAAAASAPAQQARPQADRPHITVIEDDGARIEEHRVRGTVTRVVVQSKVGGAPAYEIQVAPPGRESMSDRGSTGKRTWSLLRF